MTRAEATRERLEAEGWKFDRRATYRGYVAAGAVTPMATRKGNEYCRIHEGKCCGKNKEYQTTVVMRREA